MKTFSNGWEKIVKLIERLRESLFNRLLNSYTRALALSQLPLSFSMVEVVPQRSMKMVLFRTPVSRGKDEYFYSFRKLKRREL